MCVSPAACTERVGEFFRNMVGANTVDNSGAAIAPESCILVELVVRFYVLAGVFVLGSAAA
jgi:hypothetical protein